jgi:N-acetylneuraminic acid mutarotase
LAREGIVTAVVNNKIYAIGGFDGTTYSKRVDEYDPINNTWAQKEDMPTARAYSGAAVYNGEIYVIGGKNKSGTNNSEVDLKNVEKFNPAIGLKGTWHQGLRDLPVERRGIGVEVLKDKIIVLGGQNANASNRVDEYSPTTDTWMEKPTMPVAKGFFGTAVVNEVLYTIGGSNYDNDICTYVQTGRWSIKGKINKKRSSLAAAELNNKIYIVGGTERYGSDALLSGSLDVLEEYNPATNTSTERAKMSKARWDLGVVSVNGKIYAIGGTKSGEGCLDCVEEYDPSSNTWSTKANMNTKRAQLGVAVCNDANGMAKIYAIGGYVA